jgi:hypothetical protein
MKKIVILMSMVFLFVLQADGMVADKNERDLICGIQPYKNPKWMSEIELINGKKLHFVSVKCMMIFYYKNTKWHDLGITEDPSKIEPIKALRVQDYNTLKVIDAKKAYYVFGSHIMGPKGDDLIPFQYEKDAENFMKENGGHKILTWKNFKLNLFDLLNL